MYYKIFFLVFFVSGLGVWAMIKTAPTLGVIDKPNGRSSHGKLIPKGGGVGILGAYILSCFILKADSNLWVPTVVISLVSLWGGDKHRLSAKFRLIAQFACSFYFLMPMFLDQISLVLFLTGILISIFIVGTANFYNFMDGIDGIAGITGVVGFGLIFLYSRLNGGDRLYAALSLIIVVSCLAFLCFNLPKAKVFLGDVGSVFLGFSFACFVVALSKSFLDFIVMIGFLAPFYCDELLTMAVRIVNREPLLIPHRKHVYQLLANECGICHWKISLAYGVVQLLIGMSGILFAHKGIFLVLASYIIFSVLFLIFSIVIRKKVAFV